MDSSSSNNTNITGNSWSFPPTPTLCRCGLECPIWTSKRPHSKGRRFVGCPFFKVREKYCGYFAWYDDDFSDRAKEVIKSVDAKRDEALLKLAAMEAKLGEVEAKKKLEVQALVIELKNKDKQIASLKWFKYGLLLVVYGLALKMFKFF